MRRVARLIAISGLILGAPPTLAQLATPDVQQKGNNGDIEDTEDAACDVLQAKLIKHWKLSYEHASKAGWYCDFSTTANDYMRFVALRAKQCDAYSCLLGWYAVMRRSDVVLEWNLGEDTLVELRPPPNISLERSRDR